MSAFRKVTASISFEVEIDVTGIFQPVIGPGYDCGGEPAEAAHIEDLDMIGLFALSREDGQWKRADLLEDIDRGDVAYQLLVRNVLRLTRENAEMELIAEASE